MEYDYPAFHLTMHCCLCHLAGDADRLELRVFSVKHFSLKKASKFPVFVKGFSLLSAGTDYASLRMRACSIR